MMSVDFRAGGKVTLTAPIGRDVFLYIVEGEVVVERERVAQHIRVESDQAGEEVTLSADNEATIIFGHAPLIYEPVAASGPFVMTAAGELKQAARDYQAGRFA